MKSYFRVEFLPDGEEYMGRLDQKVREKVYYNMRKARHIKDNLLFTRLSEEIWEYRTMYLNQKVRLLAFWDKSDATATLVIVTHGITKKTSKVPNREIRKAKRLGIDYFKFKANGDENNEFR
jgi:phage-related protein